MTVHDEATNKYERLSFINTNARSLCPKTESLVDYFRELDCTLGVVTETWLANSSRLDNYVEDLQDGAGISLLYQNRPKNARGLSHGGVGILAQDARVRLTRMKFHNPGAYEVMGASAKIKGHVRRVEVIACYLPPSLPADSARECLQHVVDFIHEGKRKFDSPRIIVAGDFNQFEIARALEEHPDMVECQVGPTQGKVV